jgi:splicing factor 3A subunit 2
MDRQNRVGSKFGGGGLSSSAQTERERKERLKQLALESIDLAKDPYFIKNNIGTYECKLCCTTHRDESNYLAHTQGKKHQHALARRAHQEKLIAEQQGNVTNSITPSTSATTSSNIGQKRKIRIGRPAYQVYKSRDLETNQRCLSFEIHYPEIDRSEVQPQYRFMSAFEQKVDIPPNRAYQYLLFAAEPYETIAFKIPNEPIDRNHDRFITYWDVDSQKFTLTLYFL